ncbi:MULTISPECIES: molybdenum cofactor guanylyltransferase [Mumia]|uniref:Molybdenum cofactor guanylyltransferase n=1 Tax=Mumia xiangluensis TaxID=1678900 RepID=A0ABW1QLF5_9ACTN|nr:MULTISPECIES: molybdenum cofactor guanylyltransferase [Mumia]
MNDVSAPPESRPGPPPYDAVVLAGGAARRFGADKLATLVDGVPMLDRVLASVAGAQRRVVVGPERETAAEVVWTREDPPGSGPANAVVAGLRACAAPYAVLLAGDLPYVDAATVARLLEALVADPTADGVMLVDDDGRDQHLCSAWRRAALERAVAARPDWGGAAVRRLIAPLSTTTLAAQGREARDIDRPEDLTSSS